MIIPRDTSWAVLLCKFSPDLSTGDPMGYTANGTRVVFRGQGNHVCELSLGTSSWSMSNLTAAAPGAPNAAGDPMGYFAQVPRVVYRGQDDHVYELAIDPVIGTWGAFDMTTGAKP